MSEYNTFRCPNCKEYVNAMADNCKYCSIPFGAQMIAGLFTDEGRISDAYRSANNTRVVAGAMTTFFLLGFLPFVGFIATWVFRIMFLAIPFLLIVWTIKYGGLSKNFPEIKDARKYLLTAFGIWAIFPALLLFQVLLLLFGIFVLGYTH